MKKLAAIVLSISLLAASGCAYGPGVGFRPLHPFAPCVGCTGENAMSPNYLATQPGERLTYGSNAVGEPHALIAGCDSCGPAGPMLGHGPILGAGMAGACRGNCGGTCGSPGCVGKGPIRTILSLPIHLGYRLFGKRLYWGESCGGTYWGDWYSYPPACQDPCDNGTCGSTGCGTCGLGLGLGLRGCGTVGCSDCSGSTSGFLTSSNGLATAPGMGFLAGGSVVPASTFSMAPQTGFVGQAPAAVSVLPRTAVAGRASGSTCTSCQSGSRSPALGSPLRPVSATPASMGSVPAVR